MTVVTAGLTQASAQAEADRINQEQEKREAAIQRDRELRMRPETLRPVSEYLTPIESEKKDDES